MSRIQTSYVDYANLGDTGANTAAAIQPLQPGEAASAPNLGRAAENVRSRTEIARDVVDALLYYRDYGGRYVLDTAGGGTLAWEVGAAGRVHNDTTLTIRPFIGPRTNIKGVLRVGTATLTQVIYTVANTAYASDGMNRVTVEHRNVPGTSPVTVTISAGPVYNILVVFDASNGAHDAATVSGLVSSAIAGHSFLAGKIVVTTSATPGLAILATAGRVPLSTRVHAAGTTGNATADLEEHVLAAGALNTFTTTYPLVEGSVLAIRYDYNVEPSGSDPNDPKGGVPGGRSESNASRSSTDVSANLFRVHDYPEWIPGCIPLCKVVHGRLVWCDGTILASGTSGTPGSTYATHISPGAFSGLPTQVVNGGIDNGGDPVIQDTFVSVDERLSQSRYATWTTTDGTNSTGGHYNGVGAVTSAVAACTNGGTIVVRRGAYTTGLPAITITSGGLSLRGETHDNTLTSRTRITAAASNTVNADVTLENLAYLRTGNVRTDLARNVTLRNVTLQAGALAFGYGAGYKARLENVTMLNSVSTGTHNNAALEINSRSVHATNCEFTGPDPLSASNTPVVWQGNGTTEALYENCIFRSTKAGSQPFAFEAASGNTTFVNCTFITTTGTGFYGTDFEGLSLGGRVRYVGCRFINEVGFAVARVRPVTGTITFEDCSFEGAGSPNGVAVGFQCVGVFAPLTAAKVNIKSCTATITATDFTGILRPLLRIGSSETGLCDGVMRVDGFDIVLAGASATLPGSACVELQGNPACRYAKVTVDVAGKTAPAVTNAAIDGGPGYVFLTGGSSSRVRLQLRDFAIYNAASPAVDNVATCVAGWLYLLRTDLDGFTMSTVTSPSTNRFRCDPVALFGSSVRNAQLRLFSMNGAFASVRLQSIDAGQPSLFTRSNLADAPIAGGVGLGHVFVLDGGIVREVSMRDPALTGCSNLFLLLDTLSTHNTISGNDIRVSTDTAFFNSAFSTNTNGLEVTNNHISTGSTVTFLNAVSTLDGFRLIGNRFMTGGALAANCTPNPTTVVATDVTAVSNNTYSISLVNPS